MNFLKEPLYNSIFSGIIIYILITISNKGDPVLGAILSSLPIGLLGLIAINKENNIQNFYIKSELITNIIIIIMWITVNYVIYKRKDLNNAISIGLSTWIILSLIFYFIANYYLLIL